MGKVEGTVFVINFQFIHRLLVAKIGLSLLLLAGIFNAAAQALPEGLERWRGSVYYVLQSESLLCQEADAREACDAFSQKQAELLCQMMGCSQHAWRLMVQGHPGQIIAALPDAAAGQKLELLLSERVLFQIRSVSDIDAYQVVSGGTALPDGQELVNVDGSELPLILDTSVLLSQEHLQQVDFEYSAYNDQPAVMIELTPEGAQRFGQITQDHMGRRLAMVLVTPDTQKVISAPRVHGVIREGKLQISGVSVPEAKNMVRDLRQSMLVPMKIEQICTVTRKANSLAVEQKVCVPLKNNGLTSVEVK